MDDLILISREAAIEAAIDGADYWDGGYSPERERCIREHMAKVPPVDAAPVVRCKGCQYGKLCFDADGHSLIQCTNQNYSATMESWPLDLDWYCAGGERRDEDAKLWKLHKKLSAS